MYSHVLFKTMSYIIADSRHYYLLELRYQSLNKKEITFIAVIYMYVFKKIYVV